MWTLIGLFGVTVVVPSVAVLLYMCHGFAERSGWRRLARHYGAKRPPRLERHHFQSATLNGFGFHGILVLGAAETGLFLQPIWLLRAFHPPLLVPWRVLRAETFQAVRYNGVRLTFAHVEGVPLEWSEATHQRVTSFDPPRLPPG